MKKFTQNIAAKIISNPYVRVTKRGDWTSLQWGESMSQIGGEYLYMLSWEVQDDRVVWYEFNSSLNRVADTGMTCIRDDINLEGDDLFVRLETLEAEKEKILAAASKIYTEQSAGN